MANEFLKIGYKDSSYLVPTKNTFDKQQQSYININDLEYINLGPNLLYNSSFSVNQRGLETYNKNLGSSQQDRYTVDRWNAVQTRIVQRSENTSYNIQAAKKLSLTLASQNQTNLLCQPLNLFDSLYLKNTNKTYINAIFFLTGTVNSKMYFSISHLDGLNDTRFSREIVLNSEVKPYIFSFETNVFTSIPADTNIMFNLYTKEDSFANADPFYCNFIEPYLFYSDTNLEEYLNNKDWEYNYFEEPYSLNLLKCKYYYQVHKNVMGVCADSVNTIRVPSFEISMAKTPLISLGDPISGAITSVYNVTQGKSLPGIYPNFVISTFEGISSIRINDLHGNFALKDLALINYTADAEIKVV